MSTEMRAATLGRAVNRDLQVFVPARPVVRRGVRLREVPEGMLLEGADRSQQLSGAFASTHLPGLVALLDGSRDHADLSRETGLDPTALDSALAVLWAIGAVEEAPERPVESRLDEPMRTMLSRLGNATATNHSWTEAAQRLESTTVCVLGDPALTSLVRPLVDDLCPTSDDVGGATLVLYVRTAASEAALDTVQEACWRDGRPLLVVTLTGARVLVGPYVDPSFTPCWECATHTVDPAPLEPVADATPELAAGLAVHHLCALVSRATISHLPLDVAIVDGEQLTTTYLPPVTRPGCPRCSTTPPTAGSVGDAGPGAVFEASVAMPPRRFLDAKGHMAHYFTANIALQSSFRTWASAPTTDLPGPDLSLLSREDEESDWSLDELALALHVGLGVKQTRPDGSVKRWTAAAGNIGTVTAYVVSDGSAGLPVGVHAFLESTHQLAGLRDDVPDGHRGTLVVLTGNLRKVVAKYGTFGLKLSLLDTGCTISALRRHADHRGLRCEVLTSWDDDALSEYLGTDPMEEPVEGVLRLEAPCATT